MTHMTSQLKIKDQHLNRCRLAGDGQAGSLRGSHPCRPQQAQRGSPSDHTGGTNSPLQQPQRPLRGRQRAPVTAQQRVHRRELANVGGLLADRLRMMSACQLSATSWGSKNRPPKMVSKLELTRMYAITQLLHVCCCIVWGSSHEASRGYSRHLLRHVSVCQNACQLFKSHPMVHVAFEIVSQRN